MKIRKISLTDIEKLREIGRLTFSETFTLDNSEENINDYLESAFSIERLKIQLTAKNSEFYFAEIEGNVIGYLKVNVGDSQTEMKLNNSLEIERIYVLKEFHGKNIGQVLLEKAIQIARIQGNDLVWLGVWEQNSRAIRFYVKNGFEVFDKHNFILGDDNQTDLLMKLKLN